MNKVAHNKNLENNVLDDEIELDEHADGMATGCERMIIAQYIGDISADLKIMAQRNNMEFLAYLLDMAGLEAKDQQHKINKKDTTDE